MPKQSTETVEIDAPAAQTQLYLISALVQDEALLDKLTNLVKAAGAQIKKAESLGSKQLSVKINKHRALVLLSIFFDAPGATVDQLQKSLRHEEEIERFLITTWRGPLDQPRRNRDRKAKEETDVQS